MTYSLQDIFLEKSYPFEERTFKKGEYFVRDYQNNSRIGILTKGIMRGYISSENGEDINILFLKETDVVTGNLVCDKPSSINIQAIEVCKVWIADFSFLISAIKSDNEIEMAYNSHLNNLHAKIQKRLVSLINLNALDKYLFFLKEYPNLINRIPHYHIANYLGITPTQLSRIRKQYVSISQQM